MQTRQFSNLKRRAEALGPATAYVCSALKSASSVAGSRSSASLSGANSRRCTRRTAASHHTRHSETYGCSCLSLGTRLVHRHEASAHTRGRYRCRHAASAEWARLDSNQGPTDYESAALTAELRAQRPERSGAAGRASLRPSAAVPSASTNAARAVTMANGQRDPSRRGEGWRE
jgi:hypothetical protein